MPQITIQSVYDLLNNYTVMSDQKFTNVENELKNMKDNHIAHLKQANDELKSLQVQALSEIVAIKGIVPTVQNDVAWLKKIQWAVLTSVIATMLSVIVQIYINSIN